MWDFLGGAVGGLLGYKGAKDQTIASAQQAEKAMAFSKEAQLRQMRFQERMSGSAHQRQIADMRKAGLNPILSAKYGGASSPAGASPSGVAAPVFNKMERMLNSAQQVANIEKTRADTQLAINKGGSTLLLGQVGQNIGDVYANLMSTAREAGERARASRESNFTRNDGSTQNLKEFTSNLLYRVKNTKIFSALDAMRENIKDIMRRQRN